MMSNGMGRSNALPICQLILGTAILVLGTLDAMTTDRQPWVDWLLVLSGAAQIVVGIVTIRRNQRLDSAEIDVR